MVSNRFNAILALKTCPYALAARRYGCRLLTAAATSTPTMILNGWQRIWVVIAVLWATALSALFLGSWSTDKQVAAATADSLSARVFESQSQFVRKLAPDHYRLRDLYSNLSDEDYIEKFTSLYPDVDAQDILNYYKIRVKKPVQYYATITAYLLFSFILPLVVLYVMGFSIAWIRRG